MKESPVITGRRIERIGPKGPAIAPIVTPSRRRDESRPLPIEWLEDIEPQLSGMWLIKKLLPAQGLALIYGHPGSGKSFLAIDFAMHVALGWEWQGRAVKQGLVIYVGAEGQVGIRNRLTAFRRHHEIESKPPFALVPCPIDLQADGTDADRLVAVIRTAIDHYDAEPALIVIDTISKTFGAGKENTDDMAAYVATCERISVEFKCCVLPVHHRPKDSENVEPRGHGSLKGGVDTVILVETGKPRSAVVTKQKDGEDGERFRFNLRSIELGADEDSEIVTSCIVEPMEAEYIPADPKALAISRLADGAKSVLRILDEATIAEGIVPPPSIPDDQINRATVGKVVELKLCRVRAMSADGTGSDKSSDRIRKSFDRGIKSLQAKGIIRVFDNFVWRV